MAVIRTGSRIAGILEISLIDLMGCAGWSDGGAVLISKQGFNKAIEIFLPAVEILSVDPILDNRVGDTFFQYTEKGLAIWRYLF